MHGFRDYTILQRFYPALGYHPSQWQPLLTVCCFYIIIPIIQILSLLVFIFSILSHMYSLFTMEDENLDDLYNFFHTRYTLAPTAYTQGTHPPQIHIQGIHPPRRMTAWFCPDQYLPFILLWQKKCFSLTKLPFLSNYFLSFVFVSLGLYHMLANSLRCLVSTGCLLLTESDFGLVTGSFVHMDKFAKYGFTIEWYNWILLGGIPPVSISLNVFC